MSYLIRSRFAVCRRRCVRGGGRVGGAVRSGAGSYHRQAGGENGDLREKQIIKPGKQRWGRTADTAREEEKNSDLKEKENQARD